MPKEGKAPGFQRDWSFESEREAVLKQGGLGLEGDGLMLRGERCDEFKNRLDELASREANDTG
jgi:hypothetical protein